MYVYFLTLIEAKKQNLSEINVQGQLFRTLEYGGMLHSTSECMQKKIKGPVDTYHVHHLAYHQKTMKRMMKRKNTIISTKVNYLRLSTGYQTLFFNFFLSYLTE